MKLLPSFYSQAFLSKAHTLLYISIAGGIVGLVIYIRMPHVGFDGLMWIFSIQIVLGLLWALLASTEHIEIHRLLTENEQKNKEDTSILPSSFTPTLQDLCFFNNTLKSVRKQSKYSITYFKYWSMVSLTPSFKSMKPFAWLTYRMCGEKNFSKKIKARLITADSKTNIVNNLYRAHLTKV